MKKVMTIFGAILIAPIILPSCGGGSTEKNTNQIKIVGHCAQCSKEIYETARVDKMGNLMFCSEIYGNDCLTMYRLTH